MGGRIAEEVGLLSAFGQYAQHVRSHFRGAFSPLGKMEVGFQSLPRRLFQILYCSSRGIGAQILTTDLSSNGTPQYSACVDPGNGYLRLDLLCLVVLVVVVLGGLDKRRAQIPDLGADLRHLHALPACGHDIEGGLLVDGHMDSVSQKFRTNLLQPILHIILPTTSLQV